jgi:hypothetical protein
VKPFSKLALNTTDDREFLQQFERAVRDLRRRSVWKRREKMIGTFM